MCKRLVTSSVACFTLWPQCSQSAGGNLMWSWWTQHRGQIYLIRIFFLNFHTDAESLCCRWGIGQRSRRALWASRTVSKSGKRSLMSKLSLFHTVSPSWLAETCRTKVLVFKRLKECRIVWRVQTILRGIFLWWSNQECHLQLCVKTRCFVCLPPCKQKQRNSWEKPTLQLAPKRPGGLNKNVSESYPYLLARLNVTFPTWHVQWHGTRTCWRANQKIWAVCLNWVSCGTHQLFLKTYMISNWARGHQSRGHTVFKFRFTGVS